MTALNLTASLPLSNRNGSYEREARFYQTFGTRPAGTPATVNRHKVPIRTPEIYFCEYEPDSERLCILMQDVSDFEPLDQITGATFDEALGVMQDIGRFHVSWRRRFKCEVIIFRVKSLSFLVSSDSLVDKGVQCCPPSYHSGHYPE